MARMDEADREWLREEFTSMREAHYRLENGQTALAGEIKSLRELKERDHLELFTRMKENREKIQKQEERGSSRIFTVLMSMVAAAAGAAFAWLFGRHA